MAAEDYHDMNDYYDQQFWDRNADQDLDPDLEDDEPLRSRRRLTWNPESRSRSSTNTNQEKRQMPEKTSSTSRRRSRTSSSATRRTTSSSVRLQPTPTQLLDTRIHNLGVRIQSLETALKHHIQTQSKGAPTHDNNFLWTMSNGDTIRPQDMRDSHLRNTISFLARRLQSKLWKTARLQDLTYEVGAFHELLLEAQRRGVEV